jgi:multidrug efflux pump subunit AcrA (membrane-fusion protein)
VAIETRKKTIQHSTGGVVKDVLVKEGQWVKEGEVLMEVSDTQARANNETIRQAYLSQRAVEARLEAELQNSSSIHFDFIRFIVKIFEQLHELAHFVSFFGFASSHLELVILGRMRSFQ